MSNYSNRLPKLFILSKLKPSFERALQDLIRQIKVKLYI